MTLWIDTAVELGRNIPQPLTPRIPAGDAVPHEVVGLHVKEGMTCLRAWREYLGLTRAEPAEKAGIIQAALSRMEGGESKQPL